MGLERIQGKDGEYEVTSIACDDLGRLWPRYEKAQPSTKSRVYSVNPVGDEVFDVNCRVYTAANVEIKYVTRVEFDRDTDEGMATVQIFVTDSSGQIIMDYETNQPCVAIIRTWCKMIRKTQLAEVTA